MPTLSIDQRTVTVSEGVTILDAAVAVGVAIPTLCHRPELAALPGCMVCVVHEEVSNRLLPACATPAADGMRISTTASEALELRRTMLELLLSNHVADCEAPCQLTCPCHFDIPEMLDRISREDDTAALATVLERLALPVTLGHICPAPCEKACRRAAVDAPVAICAAKRFAGERGAQAPAGVSAAARRRRVTVIGGGPTGLAAAFHLQRQGHACTVIEATPNVGAQLLSVTAGRLPADALERDVARLRALGVVFETGAPATPATVSSLLAACDGLVLAAGAASAPLAAALGIPVANGLVAADKRTHQTANPRVFAGGAAIQTCRMAVTACAHGHAVAEQLGAWLAAGVLPPRPPERFRSRAGRLTREALAGLLADVEDGARYLPPAGGAQPAALDPDGMRYEASRCLRCECLKTDACRFRELCGHSRAVAPVFPGERTPPGRVHVQPDIVFEAAKCVLCGICVRTAAKMQAACGPAFHGRGFDMRIGPPIGREWGDVPRDVMLACSVVCPTGCIAQLHPQVRP